MIISLLQETAYCLRDGTIIEECDTVRENDNNEGGEIFLNYLFKTNNVNKNIQNTLYCHFLSTLTWGCILHNPENRYINLYYSPNTGRIFASIAKSKREISYIP